MKTVEHWIGGASTPGISARTGDVYNPATGQVQARVLPTLFDHVATDMEILHRLNANGLGGAA